MIVSSACTIPTHGHLYGDEYLPIMSDSKERVTDPFVFFSRFFANPQPYRMVSAMQRLYEQNAFENDEVAMYISGFLVGVLQKYPQETSSMERGCSRFMRGSGNDIFAFALWNANTPEAKKQLKALNEYHGNARYFLGRKLEKFNPETIESTLDLNLCWGFFHATGDLVYLRKILDCLNEDVYRKHSDANKNYVSNVAIETLTYNCILDPFILGYCKRFSETAPSAYSYDLNKVINLSDQYLAELELKKKDPKHKLPVLFENNKVGGNPILNF